MKKINILFYLFFGFILFLSSCVRTEEDLFSESAALRINRAVSDSKELLLSATNGWVMEYFPTNEQIGVTFLIKFDKNGMATVATKNEYVTTYSEGKGEWEVIAESGPVLTFNTYIDIFHLYSDPNSGLGKGLGLGLEGDYEFIVMNITDDFIQLKGKKRGTNVRLHRLDENQDWKGYFPLLDNMNTTLFNVNVTKLQLSVPDSLFTLSGGISHIFNITPYGDTMSEGVDMPFIVTDYGIRFAKPFEVGGQSIQTFKLSDDKNSLICTDENVNAKIEGPEEIAPFFHEAIDNYAKRWTLASEENSMSPNMKDAYDRIAQSFKSRKMTLGQISYYLYSEKNTSDAVYISGTKKEEGFLLFEREAVAEGVKYTFKEQFDAKGNGKAFYDNYDGVSDLMDLMSGSFKIEVVSSKLNPSKVRLTNILDENIWFTVFLQ